MILDTSAIIAIIANEPARERLTHALAAAPARRVSAATLVEIDAVTARRGDGSLSRRAHRLLQALEVETVPFDATQAAIAARAYREYGRGTGHAAALNLGDCFSYALALHLDEPLLFVGDDFRHTDVQQALAQ